MIKQDLTNKIEEEFGWLTPDEKQKLELLLKNVWNDALTQTSGHALYIENKVSYRLKNDPQDPLSELSSFINSMKL